MSKMDWRIVEGWFTQQDADFVTEICNNIKNGNIVEIGVFQGRSTAVMLPIAIKNRCNYYAIDNFFGGRDPNTPASKIQRAKGSQIKEIFEENMRLMGVNRSQYSIFQCDSQEAVNHFVDKSLDMVFIDGDNCYETVKDDLKNWYAKLKIGGAMAGHDYQMEDVKKAVDEFVVDYNVNIEININCWKITKI